MGLLVAFVPRKVMGFLLDGDVSPEGEWRQLKDAIADSHRDNISQPPPGLGH